MRRKRNSANGQIDKHIHGVLQTEYKPCVTKSFAFGVTENDLPNWMRARSHECKRNNGKRHPGKGLNIHLVYSQLA